VLLKNEQNLTVGQKTKREALSKLNLKSMRALHIREGFQAIYYASSTEIFTQLLKEWYFWATHCKIPQIIAVAKTIKRHWDGVLAGRLVRLTMAFWRA
jgi:transposase